MALKYLVKSLDEVEENLRGLYTEKDGKFFLDLDGDVYTDDDIANLKSALTKERAARKDLEKKTKTSLSEEERQELEALKKEKEDAETRTMEKKGEYEKLIKKLQTSYEEEKSTLLKQIDEEKSRTTRLVVKDKIRAAAVKSGILKENVEDVIKLTSDRFRLDGDDIVVLDEAGELSADSVSSFFEKTFKGQRPIYYEPSGGPGSGSSQTETSRKSSTGVIRLTREEARDVQTYRAAKARAEKEGIPLEVEAAPLPAQPTL